MPFCPCSLLRTHTLTHTHTHAPAPSPTSTYPSLAISCSLLPLFSEVRTVCLLGGPSSDSRVGLRPPLPSNLNLSRYQPTRRQLQPCLLKGTLPLEIMETLWQIQRLYLSWWRPLDRQDDSLRESTRFKCISWPLIIPTEVSHCVWSSSAWREDSLSEWTHECRIDNNRERCVCSFKGDGRGRTFKPRIPQKSPEQDDRLRPRCGAASAQKPTLPTLKRPKPDKLHGGSEWRTLENQSRRCSWISLRCFSKQLLMSFMCLSSDFKFFWRLLLSPWQIKKWETHYWWCFCNWSFENALKSPSFSPLRVRQPPRGRAAADWPQVIESRGEVRANHLVRQHGGNETTKKVPFSPGKPQKWRKGGARGGIICVHMCVVAVEDAGGCAGLKSQILNQLLGL